MRYGMSRGLGRPFQVNGKAGAKTRSDLVRVLSDTFTWHREIQNGRKSVPETRFDFTDNLRVTVKEMLKANEEALL